MLIHLLLWCLVRVIWQLIHRRGGDSSVRSGLRPRQAGRIGSPEGQVTQFSDPAVRLGGICVSDFQELPWRSSDGNEYSLTAKDLKNSVNSVQAIDEVVDEPNLKRDPFLPQDSRTFFSASLLTDYRASICQIGSEFSLAVLLMKDRVLFSRGEVKPRNITSRMFLSSR